MEPKKGINQAILDFDRELLALINNSDLPAAVVQLVLTGTLRQVEQATAQAVEQERAAAHTAPGDEKEAEHDD